MFRRSEIASDFASINSKDGLLVLSKKLPRSSSNPQSNMLTRVLVAASFESSNV